MVSECLLVVAYFGKSENNTFKILTFYYVSLLNFKKCYMWMLLSEVSEKY